LQDKPFQIAKLAVWEAYRRVKANKGAAGVDEQSIGEFEADRDRNLYKIWNRLSSGSYFPPPVKAVEIPKAGGKGVRVLGVPTVADRIAQTVVKLHLEPKVEPIFHPDSYGYRPGKSALDAVAACRQRCWRADWVIDLDIRAFFDTVPWDLVLKAVAHHTDQKMDSAVCGAVAESAAATARWHAGQPGPRDPAGVGDLTVAGEPVHALRVRRLDGPGVPGCSVRALLR
jgi:RNA-directed DNA polymerase